jgi:hypothetical protein
MPYDKDDCAQKHNKLEREQEHQDAQLEKGRDLLDAKVNELHGRINGINRLLLTVAGILICSMAGFIVSKILWTVAK